MTQREKTVLKIQRLAVANPDTARPTIEMTLADHEFIDEATQIIVASVKVAQNEESMERYQLEALREMIASLEGVTRELKQKLDAGTAHLSKRSA